METFRLSSQVVRHDDHAWTTPSRVAGVDVSFLKSEDVNALGCEPDVAVAALVILEFPSLEVIYEDFVECQISVPYIPGFLAFREVSPVMSLFQRLKDSASNVLPDVLFVDGNGVYHERGCGLASHLGVVLDIPSIGVTKNMLNVDPWSKEKLEAVSKTKLRQGGDAFELLDNAGLPMGAATFRATNTAPRAVVVSIGHRVSLETALTLMRVCCKYRVCEPIRQADLRSREKIRQILANRHPPIPY